MDGITAEYDYTYDDAGRLLTVRKDDTLVEEYEYGANGARENGTNPEFALTNQAC